MARYPADHKEATRRRILAASERLLKRDGVDRASVDAVMREAGLTVGGFYAHFASKEDLARQSLLFAVEESFGRLTRSLDALDDRAFVRTLVKRYFEQATDPKLEHACPLTILLPEVARAPADFRNEFAQRTGALLRAVEGRFPASPGLSQRETTLAVFATLAGAVSMARTAATPQARTKIARAAEQFLLTALGLEPPVTGGRRRADSRSRRRPASPRRRRSA